jgi:L-threonylcarbamoyladenylate synthase
LKIKNQNILIDKVLLELNKEKVCILPTDTFYSLSVVADSNKAIENLFTIKNREANKPIPLLISGLNDIERFCDISSSKLQKLSETFWPGPLTIVLPVNDLLPKELNNGSGFIGFRVPNHYFTKTIIEKLGKPITGTSANISNIPPSKNILEIISTFKKTVSTIVDIDCGKETHSSTVIKIDKNESIDILRQGPITLDKIKETINN